MKMKINATIMIILAILSMVFLLKDLFDLSMILLYVLLIMSIILNFQEGKKEIEKVNEEKDEPREI